MIFSTTGLVFFLNHIYTTLHMYHSSLYRVPAGTYRAMAGGYFLFVKPLTVGEHKIDFKETFFKPGFEGQPSSENRLSNVIYDL